MRERTDRHGGDDGDALGRRILQNEELVRRIRESADNPSAPMTVEEFMEWLRRPADDAAPPP